MRLAYGSVVLAATLWLSTAGASAATVSVKRFTDPGDSHSGPSTAGRVVFTAAPGEANDLTVSGDPGGAQTFADAAATVTPGPGCMAAGSDGRAATCGGVPLEGASISLGDGDDHLTADGATLVDAGPGDDVVTTSGGRLEGGPGDDHLTAGVATFVPGPGNDVVTATGSTTSTDRSTLSDADLAGPVTVDLARGVADAPGDSDRISGIGNVVGTSAGDVLVGDDGPNKLAGGPGGDTIDGAAGRDWLAGGSGANVVRGGPGDDSLQQGAIGLDPDEDDTSGPAAPTRYDGGDGDDTINASTSGDSLVGGSGADELVGEARGVSILADDGVADGIDCSYGERGATGAGSATADGKDRVHDCATLHRSAPAAPQLLVLGLADGDRDGLLHMQIACSQDQRGGCHVHALVRHGSRVVARRRTVIASGTLKTLRPDVSSVEPRGCAKTDLTVSLRGRRTDGRPWLLTRHTQLYSLAIVCNYPSLLSFGDEW